MQYLSPEFGLCFLIFLWLYWLVGKFGNKAQNILLLIASYAFYASFSWRFLVLLIIFSLIILGLARLLIDKYEDRHRWPLYLGIFYAVCNLGVFKYYNFFREEAGQLLSPFFHISSLPVLDIVMPVGISFYTFQGLAYLISVYREEKPAAGWLDGLLHLAFFPTLLAGPICRPTELLTQIESPEPRSPQHVEFAMLLMLLAIIKKVWLAAWLADAWSTPVFANPDTYHPVELACGLMAYAWQLFFDFSGYTDAVTAFALLLGFQLPKNFRQPYLSADLSDFWRRWHMTLSRWIRDFVYIPLGGNRGTWGRTQINIIIAMTISGFWHGASLTFIAWGLWHGIGLAAQNTWQRITDIRLPNFFALPLTFIFVCAGWLLFRASDWSAVVIYTESFTHWNILPHTNWLGFLFAMLSFFIFSHYADAIMASCETKLMSMYWWMRALILVAISLAVISLSPAGMPGFIYFGF